MPAESRRLRRRVRARDRWFLAAATGVALVGTPAATLLASSSATGTRPGCVSTREAGFMGGQTVTVCGAQAAALCRSAARREPSLAAECRRAERRRP